MVTKDTEKVYGREVSPREAIELMITHGDCTAEDIAEWAMSAEEQMFAQEYAIEDARDKVVEALMDYNAVLGYGDEELDPEFWDTLFDYYEESMAYLHDTVNSIKDAIEDLTREEEACKEADCCKCASTTKEEEKKEENLSLSDFLEILFSE